MISLQIGIAATGNYGFFNLLTIVLYVALLDDRTLARVLPRGLARSERPADGAVAPMWRITVSAAALGIAAISVLTRFREIDATRGRRGPIAGEWSDGILAFVSRVNSVNGYGLFRVMTTERPEIVIEVSEDGRAWTEWEFRWKAGNVMRRPVFVEPHMPRLDWQMWFAALDPSAAQGWLQRLTARLLDGDAGVMRLLGPKDQAPSPKPQGPSPKDQGPMQ